MNQESFNIIAASVPHVADKIKLFWGSEFLQEYVDQLMLDTRDGQRRGFAPAILIAIQDLYDSHANQFPHLHRSKGDIWDII